MLGAREWLESVSGAPARTVARVLRREVEAQERLAKVRGVTVEDDGMVFDAKASGANRTLPQLLLKYLKNGRIVRARRGVYRIVHFPAGEHEDLATLWLWSAKAGVFSHETALMLHDLGGALPRKVNLTLPTPWAKRRLRVPEGVLLHYHDVPRKERVEVGAVPVTSAHRTLIDCASAHVSPELVETAIEHARARGLIDKDDVKEIRARARAA